MHKAALFILLAALFVGIADTAHGGPPASLFLSANPDAIVADGKSVCTVTAEVRDSSGNLVPDGTQISFSTNLGTIQSSERTTAGVARARLTSGAVVGAATVSAWVTQGGAIGQVKVELLEPGSELPRESFITIASDTYLIYDPEQMVIYAEGGARIVHRGLVIQAEEAQLEVETATLKCRRRTGGTPIRLARGRNSLEASLVYYRLSDMKGKAIREGEAGSVERLAFRGADLAVEPEAEPIPESYFEFADLSESPVAIKCSVITVRPRGDIQLHRAKVYVDGKKVLSLPLHVLPLDGSGRQGAQYLGWGTNGLRVDLPFYYSLSPNSAGSVHLRHGQQTGWGFYSADSGWSLDMVQDYTTGAGGEGSFVVNRLNGGDWGAHWHHNYESGSGGRVYSYIDYPAHRDLFGMVNISRPLSRANLGINFYGNKFRSRSADFSTDVYLQSLPKPIAGGAANYVLLGRTSYSRSGGASGSGMAAGLQLQIFGRPISLSPKTSLTGSLSLGHDWGGARSGVALLGNASFTHRLGSAGNLGLVYSYAQDAYTIGQYGRHRLSTNLLYMPPSGRWQAMVFSTYTLDQPLSSTFADVSYKLRPGWRLNLLQTFQKYGQYHFSDTEIALGKKVGNYELLLIWSESRNRFRIDLSTARF